MVTLSQRLLWATQRRQSLGSPRTVQNYQAAFNSFSQFIVACGTEEVPLSEVDSLLMERYQQYLKGRGVKMNTISFYMRILRAVYNQAVEDELIADKKPFRKVYVGIARTSKRAISLDDIRLIANADLSDYPRLDWARLTFMFLFYMRGMSFIDAALLKKSDIYNGFLTYQRRKTGQVITIRWEPEMQSLVNAMNTYNDSEYLLPLMRYGRGCKEERSRRTMEQVNRFLKKIAQKLSLAINLTTYVARHSWATIARQRQVPISVISQGLGHDSDATTYIYLSSLESTVVDSANAMLIRETMGR